MDKTNDYEYTKNIRETVEEYLKQNKKIDDVFFERFLGKKAQAQFLSGNVEDKSLEDAIIMNGLSGVDCRNVDFSKLSLNNYIKIPFDSKTKFPKDVAEVFSTILEKAKEFGYGLEGLIREGKLSGNGINVAIMDEDVDISKMDTNDINIVHEEESDGHHYHGLTVSSLLASKSCGVAKGATVHFFKKTNQKSIQFERIIEYNKNCKQDSDKILVLSGSWSMKDDEFTNWQQALREVGCELVCQNNFIRNFTEISGDDIILDMSEEEKEGFSERMRTIIDSTDLDSLVKIPINRTYHQYGYDDRESYEDKNVDFKYQASYSNSWGIPQVAGLLALFKAKYKNLTFENFCELCKKTAKEKGIINPVGIYEEMEKRIEQDRKCENLKPLIEDDEVR